MLGKVQIILLITGALLAFASDWLKMSQLLPVGMALIGGSVLFMGLETILTRKIKWYRDRYYYERYSGAAAVALGFLLSVAGLILIAYSIAAFFGRETALIDLVLARYGIFIFLLSLFYFLRGLAAAIGYENPAKTLNDRMAKGFDRLLGFISFLLGLLGMGIGVFQFFFPEPFHAMIRSLFQTILHLFL